MIADFAANSIFSKFSSASENFLLAKNNHFVQKLLIPLCKVRMHLFFLKFDKLVHHFLEHETMKIILKIKRILNNIIKLITD